MQRRDFLVAAAAAGGAHLLHTPVGAAFARQPRVEPPRPGDTHRGPCVVASANANAATGGGAVARAMELLKAGADPAEAVVGGVKLVEDDPNDQTVGLGGLPNEDGVVELDASVMHGPTHKSGAVASLRGIKNPAAVALLVCRRTDHCLLVGEGALRFAKARGFVEENLLTEKSRQDWIKWREQMSKVDNWLGDDQIDRWKSDPKEAVRIGERALPDDWRFHTGTIHCSAVDKDGDIGSCTTTSGLSWKLAGRVGDSPIIGAGNYCDNAVGAAGSTGRGEANLTNLASYAIVREMEAGLSPTEACLKVAKRVADHTREKRLLNEKGLPRFNVLYYALRKDGAWGGASLWSGGKMAVCDEQGPRTVEIPYLFETPATK